MTAGARTPGAVGRTPRQQVVHHLRRGAGAGLVLGVVAAAGVALAGFPEWALVAWGFLFGFAWSVLPWAFAVRALAHLSHWDTERRVPRERRRPVPDEQLTLYWWAYPLGACLLVVHLVVTVAFFLGEGRVWPF